MGLYKQYFRIGRYARDHFLGASGGVGGGGGGRGGGRGVKDGGGGKLQMLISDRGKQNQHRVIILMLGMFILSMGVILSSIPWLDYIILKDHLQNLLEDVPLNVRQNMYLQHDGEPAHYSLQNLRLWNGSLSYQYWQRPGVVRLTKVYIFNVTNPDSFLNLGEKPRLQEIGPFVYREDMEKVNVKFHENGTLTYQHKKILQFVPELSVNKHQKITVPNISLLTLSTQSNSLGYFVQKSISLLLTLGGFKPFVTITADQLVFGYDDQLVKLAHNFYPKRKRPTEQMGLLLTAYTPQLYNEPADSQTVAAVIKTGFTTRSESKFACQNERNGTLTEVHNIYTGTTGMEDFGLLEKLNGDNSLPYWKEAPCNAIKASEGSFFPPRHFTKSDVLNLYDKDLCRVMPLKYRGPVSKHGISADLYTPIDSIFDNVSDEPNNKCYCPGNEYCPPRGLQNISPCHYDAPVYLSFPHFFQADPSLIEPFQGLRPVKEKHQSYFKIQPKLGVPIEGKIRVQLNLKVDQAPNVAPVAKFPSIIHPIMWVEEGIDDVTPPIRRWIYLATTFADIASPLMTYGFIFLGTCILIGVFINTYKSLVFTKETIEIGMKNLRRRGSCYVAHPRIIARRDTYSLLDFKEDSSCDLNLV